MDYGTFFFTNIVTVTVFTASIAVLAWYNRRVIGMHWFSGALITGLIKLILQGMEGKVPAVFSDLPANELYVTSFMMQWMGLRWFVVRKRLQSPWPWIATGVVLTAYTVMFFRKTPYIGNVLNVPFVIICGASAWMMFRNAREPFAAASRVTGAVLVGQMVVAGYRAALTNLRYMRPWETVHAQTDPRWLYSLAAGAFLAACMVMCELWLLVTDLQRALSEQARTDSLTGAMNRRAMEEVALRETSRCIRHASPLCMVMLDIDDFKRQNDTRGHAAGDRVLQALVCQVKSMLRAQDLFARTGGEEFAILLPDTLASDGVVAAERIRCAVEELTVPFETGPIKFTASAYAESRVLAG